MTDTTSALPIPTGPTAAMTDDDADVTRVRVFHGANGFGYFETFHADGGRGPTSEGHGPLYNNPEIAADGVLSGNLEAAREAAAEEFPAADIEVDDTWPVEVSEP